MILDVAVDKGHITISPQQAKFEVEWLDRAGRRHLSLIAGIDDPNEARRITKHEAAKQSLGLADGNLQRDASLERIVQVKRLSSAQ